ncbi:hypothetical protein SDC9_93288 [bioreactor metagenome]|uniref:Uncharacterized protein n=1 Tax=bioreactor metagenome TaxID=1076179 RepID=A0A645AA53_9ZZZZ
MAAGNILGKMKNLSGMGANLQIIAPQFLRNRGGEYLEIGFADHGAGFQMIVIQEIAIGHHITEIACGIFDENLTGDIIDHCRRQRAGDDAERQGIIRPGFRREDRPGKRISRITAENTRAAGSPAIFRKAHRNTVDDAAEHTRFPLIAGQAAEKRRKQPSIPLCRLFQTQCDGGGLTDINNPAARIDADEIYRDSGIQAVKQTGQFAGCDRFPDSPMFHPPPSSVHRNFYTPTTDRPRHPPHCGEPARYKI